MSPTRRRRGRRGGPPGRGSGCGEVAGLGEGDGGPEVAVPKAFGDGQFAQRGGEESGGEGIARADGGDDVDARGGFLVASVGVVRDRAVGAALDDEQRGLGQRIADRVGSASDAPGVLGLVVADEHDVGAAREFQEYVGALGGAGPQAGPVVDVEGDEGAARARSGQLAQQVEAAGGERGGDPGQVQDPAGAQRVQVQVGGGHRGGGGSGAVVGDLVGGGGPVARGAEVDAGGPVQIAAYGGGVDAVRADGLHEVVAEPVGADPADPCGPVPGGGEHARHVGLGAADPAIERGHVGEPPRHGGPERDHGLAERDYIVGAGRYCGSGGGHGGSHSSRQGTSGFVDPTLARMLDSMKRHTQ